MSKGITPEIVRDQHWFSSERSRKIWNTKNARKRAGSLRTLRGGYRYIQLGVLGRMRIAHRIIWMWMTGDNPPDQIDHINRIPTDNRWDNLRAATPTENNRNSSLHRNNTSGHAGVSWCKDRSKWRASIQIDMRQYNLGGFSSLEEAILARKAAEAGHGFSECHGNPRPYS